MGGFRKEWSSHLYYEDAAERMRPSESNLVVDILRVGSSNMSDRWRAVVK